MKQRKGLIAIVAILLVLCLTVCTFFLVKWPGVREFRTLTITYSSQGNTGRTFEIVIDAKSAAAYATSWPGDETATIPLDPQMLADYQDYVFRFTKPLNSADHNPEDYKETGALRLWEITATDNYGRQYSYFGTLSFPYAWDDFAARTNELLGGEYVDPAWSL